MAKYVLHIGQRVVSLGEAQDGTDIQVKKSWTRSNGFFPGNDFSKQLQHDFLMEMESTIEGLEIEDEHNCEFVLVLPYPLYSDIELKKSISRILATRNNYSVTTVSECECIASFLIREESRRADRLFILDVGTSYYDYYEVFLENEKFQIKRPYNHKWNSALELLGVNAKAVGDEALGLVFLDKGNVDAFNEELQYWLEEDRNPDYDLPLNMVIPDSGCESSLSKLFEHTCDQLSKLNDRSRKNATNNQFFLTGELSKLKLLKEGVREVFLNADEKKMDDLALESLTILQGARNFFANEESLYTPIDYEVEVLDGANTEQVNVLSSVSLKRYNEQVKMDKLFTLSLNAQSLASPLKIRLEGNELQKKLALGELILNKKPDFSMIGNNYKKLSLSLEIDGCSNVFLHSEDLEGDKKNNTPKMNLNIIIGVKQIFKMKR